MTEHATGPRAVYQWCFECGQVYATAAELLAAHNEILAADGLALETNPSRVVTCPQCVHDFLYPPDASAAGSMSDVTTPRQLCGELPMEAGRIAEALRRNGFDSAGAVNRQVLGLAEEAGEFVGAYRRWSGQARRTGTAGEMFDELADVIITAFVTAHELGVDINEVIAAKLHKVHTRGWREVPR